jgi:hypothetical protein
LPDVPTAFALATALMLSVPPLAMVFVALPSLVADALWEIASSWYA